MERIVGVLSPPDVYFTLTFGYSFMKPLRTAWNRFCSGPVQIPMIERFPETASFLVVFVVLSLRCRAHCRDGECRDAERRYREAKPGHATSFCLGCW